MQTSQTTGKTTSNAAEKASPSRARARQTSPQRPVRSAASTPPKARRMDPSRLPATARETMHRDLSSSSALARVDHRKTRKKKIIVAQTSSFRIPHCQARCACISRRPPSLSPRKLRSCHLFPLESSPRKLQSSSDSGGRIALENSRDLVSSPARRVARARQRKNS